MLNTVALSPDGRILATGGLGLSAGKWGNIYLINLVTRRIELVLTGHTSSLITLAFSPDGKRLASGSHDQTARIWEVATGNCEQRLQGHDREVLGITFSPDGRRVATASFDRTARIWSVATGKCEAVLGDHTREVRCVAWSPDGRTIATGSWDQSIRLGNADGTARQSFEKFHGTIQSVTFTPDGRQLLVTQGSTDQITDCLMLDLATGEEQVHFRKHPGPVGWMSGTLSPDGRLAATASGGIYVWKTGDGTVVTHLGSKGERPWRAAWSLAGRAIAWGNTRPRGFRPINDPGPLERMWSLPELELRPTGDQPLRRAQASRGSWSLERTGRTTVAVMRSGETVSELKLSDPYERIQCFTLLCQPPLEMSSFFPVRNVRLHGWFAAGRYGPFLLSSAAPSGG